jgi:uncharacterized protein (TIGR02266 family)
MARYWIADAKRNILGPVDEQVLADLAADGKLTRIELVSREGGAWAPPQSFPEIAGLFVAPGDEQRLARDREEAQRLALLLDNLREKPIHELFGVPPKAPFEEVRRGYITAAKRFHPARVAADAAPELRQACLELFEFLAGRLREEERRRKAAAVGPGYLPQDFLGLERRREGRVEARVKVTTATAGMFSDNHTVNLSTGGLFLATDRLVPLGTRLDLFLDFEAEGRTVQATGVVVWENGEARPKQPRGFGVRFLMLRSPDRKFLEEWVARCKAEAEQE